MEAISPEGLPSIDLMNRLEKEKFEDEKVGRNKRLAVEILILAGAIGGAIWYFKQIDKK